MMQHEKQLLDWLKELDAIDIKIDSPKLIKRLDLSSKSLSTLPQEISLLTNLISLNLSNNNLKELPKGIRELRILNTLDLRRNSFTDVPDLIPCEHLRSLNISGNKITNATMIARFSKLRVLDISDNEIVTLQECFAPKNQLRTLNISLNYIQEINHLWSYFDSLERLNLTENLITNISKEISKCKNLIYLNCSNNHLQTIDNALFALEIEELDLSSNELTILNLHALENLETLIIDNNPVQSLHVREDFAPYLREFSCDGCGLKEFISFCSKEIESLIYSSNSLTHIPEQLCQYQKLKYLDFENNNITKLPQKMANVTTLQTLYIASNPLNDEAKHIIEILHPDICDIHMKTGITIEDAQEEDLGQMAELLSVLFTIEKDFKIDYKKQLSGITKLFHYEGAKLLVAKDETKVVGMLTMQRLISSAAGDYIGQLEDLVVKEEYRKMGIASRLINKMRFIALQEYGYKRIQLAADMDNTNALNFYARRGFTKTHLNIYHYTV